MQSSSSDDCICHFNFNNLILLCLKLQLINTKPKVKNKLKEMLTDLNKINVQKILALKYKIRNHHKTFHSNAKQI